MRIDASTLVVVRTGDTIPAVAAHRGQFFGWIQAGLGDAWRGPVVEVDAREPLDDGLLGAGALILTGSPASVTERAPWMLALEERMRQAFERRVPALGICFGHQIMAQALGGHVAKNPRGREIGTVRVSLLAEHPMFEGLGGEFPANATHTDTVARLPEGARVLATTALDDVAAFVVGSFWAVQFHPEIDGEIMRSYLTIRRPLLEAERIAVDELLDQASDTPSGPRILQNFARSAGGTGR